MDTFATLNQTYMDWARMKPRISQRNITEKLPINLIFYRMYI